MIFVINKSRTIYYLSLMLLLTRDNISLQVYYNGLEVQVTPPLGQFETSHFIYTYAQGEEELARFFLDHIKPLNPGLQLKTYFIQQGWRVEERE